MYNAQYNCNYYNFSIFEKIAQNYFDSVQSKQLTVKGLTCIFLNW